MYCVRWALCFRVHLEVVDGHESQRVGGKILPLGAHDVAGLCPVLDEEYELWNETTWVELGIIAQKARVVPLKKYEGDVKRSANFEGSFSGCINQRTPSKFMIRTKMDEICRFAHSHFGMNHDNTLTDPLLTVSPQRYDEAHPLRLTEKFMAIRSRLHQRNDSEYYTESFKAQRGLSIDLLMY